MVAKTSHRNLSTSCSSRSVNRSTSWLIRSEPRSRTSSRVVVENLVSLTLWRNYKLHSWPAKCPPFGRNKVTTLQRPWWLGMATCWCASTTSRSGETSSNRTRNFHCHNASGSPVSSTRWSSWPHAHRSSRDKRDLPSTAWVFPPWSPSSTLSRRPNSKKTSAHSSTVWSSKAPTGSKKQKEAKATSRSKKLRRFTQIYLSSKSDQSNWRRNVRNIHAANTNVLYSRLAVEVPHSSGLPISKCVMTTSPRTSGHSVRLAFFLLTIDLLNIILNQIDKLN